MGKETPWEMLEKCHLPQGLLPRNVTDYELSEDGHFQCTLSEPVNVTFGDSKSSRKVHYKSTIKCVVKDLSLTHLEGVTSKSLLLWVGVTTISRDTPTSDFLRFYAGPVGITLPVAWFEK